MTRALVAGDSMLKDLAGSFTSSSRTHVEVRSFSGVRIEKLFSLIAHTLADVHVVVLHVGTNNVGEEPLVLIARFRSLISRILVVNPSIRVVVSAILPRQASLRKCQWALSVGESEVFNTDARATNAILQALCHKNGCGFVDGTHELMGMLKADGVHPTKRGSQVAISSHKVMYINSAWCRSIEAEMPNNSAPIKQASKDLEASHNEALQQQHQKEKDHKKLQFQRAPAFPCKEMWSDVARKSDSATIQCHNAMSVTPKVAETDTAQGYLSLPITAVASTRAPVVTVFTQVKRRHVRAPALVGGVWMQHKVKKTGRTAVPLCSAAFEQSPPSDCGPPDACGVTSTVSPQSEGVALRKGTSAADTSASTPRGDPRAEKEVRIENKKGRSNKKPVSPALVSGACVHHKVKKTGRTAVPLCSAAFEQSPPSDCGPLDACGVTSTVSPQSEGVVLRKDHSAVDPSTSSRRGEDPEQEQKATSAKLSHSHICTSGGNLSVGSKFSTYKEFKASFEG
ncbi:hypothetical protein HPB51_021500 [Rhipicephalus microplus]|uniref:SGNH hydrolase-type esterase domain-containing protein n=1 Tax=Rhipicephalus microplus TaxID=6941 RepID=A0A9J6DJJ9_RHIMP|nr:hypothetical protein HPB51_021500 [Rhipicephalus microplus]